MQANSLSLLSRLLIDKYFYLTILCILSLGLAYAGSWREDVITILSDVYTDRVANANDKLITSEVISVTALSMGLVGLGSCNAELATKLLSVFDKEAYNLKSTFNRYLNDKNNTFVLKLRVFTL